MDSLLISLIKAVEFKPFLLPLAQILYKFTFNNVYSKFYNLKILISSEIIMKQNLLLNTNN